MLKLLTLGTFFPEANSKAVPAIHFFGFPGAFDVRIFPDVLFVWHKKYFEKKRVKIELGTPNLSIHIFFLGGLCVYIYIYYFQKSINIYIYIFIFAQYALPYSGATPSLPATRYLREKSQNRKSPKYIYLHLFPYTTQINNLGIHRPAADFCIDFLF